MSNTLVFLIRCYQYLISPIFTTLGFSRCRFVPTCSEYTSLSIKRYGTLRGILLGLKRLIDCQPWVAVYD